MIGEGAAIAGKEGSCKREERKLAFNFPSAAEAQPKVNEQDFSNNLFWLDYGARQYDPTRGHFTTPDISSKVGCTCPWRLSPRSTVDASIIVFAQ